MKYLLKQLVGWVKSMERVSIVHLTILGILSLISCSSTHPTHHDHEPAGVHFSPTSFILEDMAGKVHRYKENIQTLHLPLQNPKLTQYCMVHFVWEDIHVLRELRKRSIRPGLKSRHSPFLIIKYRIISHSK